MAGKGRRVGRVPKTLFRVAEDGPGSEECRMMLTVLILTKYSIKPALRFWVTHTQIT